jgi:hypothetical protein
VPMLSSTTRFLGFAEFYLCSGRLSVDVCHKKQLAVVSCWLSEKTNRRPPRAQGSPRFGVEMIKLSL